MKNALHALTQDLLFCLEGEKMIILATLEAGDGSPSLNAISWVKPVSDSRIRFSIAANSRIIDNITKHPKASICMFGLESIYMIMGTCTVLEEKMEGVQLRLSKIEMEIERIEDRMFFGSKVVQEPETVKTYNPEKAKEIDEKVFAALVK